MGWHSLHSPSGVTMLGPDRIFPAQYTRLVWTRRLRHNQRGFRRPGAARQVVRVYSRIGWDVQPQVRLVQTEGHVQCFNNIGVPAGRALRCFFKFSECLRGGGSICIWIRLPRRFRCGRYTRRNTSCTRTVVYMLEMIKKRYPLEVTCIGAQHGPHMLSLSSLVKLAKVSSSDTSWVGSPAMIPWFLARVFAGMGLLFPFFHISFLEALAIRDQKGLPVAKPSDHRHYTGAATLSKKQQKQELCEHA